VTPQNLAIFIGMAGGSYNSLSTVVLHCDLNFSITKIAAAIPTKFCMPASTVCGSCRICITNIRWWMAAIVEKNATIISHLAIFSRASRTLRVAT